MYVQPGYGVRTPTNKEAPMFRTGTEVFGTKGQHSRINGVVMGRDSATEWLIWFDNDRIELCDMDSLVKGRYA